jgi:hypothetical protein
MVDLTGNFKRNGCERVLRYTIRYTSLRFVIYAVDIFHRVETCMTYNCPAAQANLWSWIAPAVRIRLILGSPDRSGGGAK